MSLTNISTSDPAFVHAVQQVLEVLGTLAFAVSGIRHAAAKHLDWFGGYVCGFAVAVGGGTLRDVMLGTTPFWMTSPIYVICTFAALGFVVCFGRHIRWIDNAWFVFDTLGLALFVIAGIQKTVAFEHPYWVAIIMGSMTGGGRRRDTRRAAQQRARHLSQRDLCHSMCGRRISILGAHPTGCRHSHHDDSHLFLCMRHTPVGSTLSY